MVTPGVDFTLHEAYSHFSHVPTFCNPTDSLLRVLCHGTQVRIILTGYAIFLLFSRSSLTQGSEPTFLVSSALAGGFFTLGPLGKPLLIIPFEVKNSSFTLVSPSHTHSAVTDLNWFTHHLVLPFRNSCK